MVFWLIVTVVLASSESLNLVEKPRISEYISQVILEYPTFSILLSIVFIFLSILALQRLYKRVASSSEVDLLVKSRHIRDKEIKSLIS